METVSNPARPTGLGLAKRRLSPDRASRAEQSLGRFVRTEQWNGFTAGDVVRIAGHASRGRHWRFTAHVTNTSNGASWVEVALVAGPAPGRRDDVGERRPEEPRVERVRSFSPDLVQPRFRRRGRRAALATAEDASPLQQSMF